MTVKSIAIAAAALAAIGAVAAGVTSVLSESPAGYQVQLIVCGAPLPQEPAPTPTPASTAAVPTATQLTDLLNSLADPSVPFADKSNLVEGGIGGAEARVADHRMQKAAKNGSLPLSFTVANIKPGAAGSATADVSVSGPKLSPPITQNITFVNQGSWMLSRSSAMELLKAAGTN